MPSKLPRLAPRAGHAPGASFASRCSDGQATLPRRGWRPARLLAAQLPEDGRRRRGRIDGRGRRRQRRRRSAAARAGRGDAEPEGERRAAPGDRRAAGDAARRPAQPPRPDGREAGVRPRRLRRLHRAARRRAGEVLHDARGRRGGPRDHDGRGHRHAREDEPAAAGVRREGRAAVRLLHARLRGRGHRLPGEAPESRRSRRSSTASRAISAAAARTAASSRRCRPPRRRRGGSHGAGREGQGTHRQAHGPARGWRRRRR